MSHITKPKIHHPSLKPNKLGLTRRDYEGSLSTLCAGCGHDSITAAIIQAFYELELPPHMVAKLSGIGCSSKTTAYFLREAHGFNSVHGRMPSIASGAGAANRSLYMIGISGDGDSLAIGLGQFCHAVRRNVNLLYVLENNGVYGLTKGQFSPSTDVGSSSKRGEVNAMSAIDAPLLALTLGATFVARGFSGDKGQLVPIIKAGLMHHGFAFVDIISPCVTFNDHEGSTKSYAHTRKMQHTLTQADYIPMRDEITSESSPGSLATIQLHDGGFVKLRKVDEGYDPTDRDKAYAYIRERTSVGEIPTGVLYAAADSTDMVDRNNMSETPLVNLRYEDLCPGSEKLDEFQRQLR